MTFSLTKEQRAARASLPSEQRNYYETILRARQDPIWFAEEIMQHKVLPGEHSLEDVVAAGGKLQSWELDKFQVDLLNAVCDIWREDSPVINLERKSNISVVSGHGPGKTHTGALLVHYFNFCWPARSLITAPKFDQVKTRMFAALQRIDYRALPMYRATHGEMGDTQCYWSTPDGSRNRDHCIIGETANNPENLAGHHSPYQLVLVEEATGVEEKLAPVIFGALSTGVIQILVLISNPTQRQGFFADSHLRPIERDKYFRYHVRFEDSRRVSRAWAQRLIDKYGPNSPIVKVRVFGLFASDDPRQLIAMQWIVDSQNRSCDPDGSRPRKRITIDVADGGECETIVTLAEQYQSKKVGRRMRRFSHPAHLSPIMAADEGERMWKEFNCNAANGDDIVVDSIGVGAGTAGELMRRGYPVVPYQGGAGSSDTKQWRNCRVQSYCLARNEFRDRNVAFDPDFFEDSQDWDDFIAQLCSIKTKDNGEKVEDIQTKKEMTDLGIPSPDMADSWIMQNATAAPQLLTQPDGEGTGADVPVLIPARRLDGMFRG